MAEEIFESAMEKVMPSFDIVDRGLAKMLGKSIEETEEE